MPKETTNFSRKLYLEENYKSLLLNAISENSGVTGYKGKLAQAAGCQSSYLSQVIGGDAHLTPDHAAGLADFWDLSESETSYFTDLIYLERASSTKLKQILSKRIKDIRAKLSSTSASYEGKSFEIEEKYRAEFYLKWHMSAIYMLSTMKNFNSIKKISDHINLAPDIVSSAIEKLQEMGLIRKKSCGNFESVHETLFLFEGSPYRTAFRNSYRQLALVKSYAESADNLAYTMLYTLNRETKKKLNEIILNFIRETKEFYDSQEPHEHEDDDDLSCLAIDFFKI